MSCQKEVSPYELAFLCAWGEKQNIGEDLFDKIKYKVAATDWFRSGAYTYVNNNPIRSALILNICKFHGWEKALELSGEKNIPKSYMVFLSERFKNQKQIDVLTEDFEETMVSALGCFEQHKILERCNLPLEMEIENAAES